MSFARLTNVGINWEKNIYLRSYSIFFELKINSPSPHRRLSFPSTLVKNNEKCPFSQQSSSPASFTNTWLYMFIRNSQIAPNTSSLVHICEGSRNNGLPAGKSIWQRLNQDSLNLRKYWSASIRIHIWEIVQTLALSKPDVIPDDMG